MVMQSTTVEGDRDSTNEKRKVFCSSLTSNDGLLEGIKDGRKDGSVEGIIVGWDDGKYSCVGELLSLGLLDGVADSKGDGSKLSLGAVDGFEEGLDEGR